METALKNSHFSDQIWSVQIIKQDNMLTSFPRKW